MDLATVGFEHGFSELSSNPAEAESGSTSSADGESHCVGFSSGFRAWAVRRVSLRFPGLEVGEFASLGFSSGPLHSCTALDRTRVEYWGKESAYGCGSPDLLLTKPILRSWGDSSFRSWLRS